MHNQANPSRQTDPINDDDVRLMNAHPKSRIFSISRQGQTVWIKRQGIEKLPFGKKMHHFFSPLLPCAFMRASPKRSPEDMNAQEIRKIHAFQQAGIATPELIAAAPRTIMISDVGAPIQKQLGLLRKTDTITHDALLIECAKALGNAHHAGLAHGRPHPRDMFLQNGQTGFFDFEEEPEAVMPISMAQARDAWLLFFQISAQAIDKQTTSKRAFDVWADQVDPKTLDDLRRLVRFFTPFVLPLKLLRPIYLGGDGKRMLSAMEFLISYLNERAGK